MGEAFASNAGAGNDAQGIFFVMFSEFLLAFVNVIVKYVHDWSTQRMMFVRNTTDLCLCLAMWAWCRYTYPGHGIAGFLILRGCAYIAFVYFFWASLHSCLPLGDVVLLVVTFSPTWFVLLARLQLGEKIPTTWPYQFAMCVIGAALINKPGVPDKGCPASTALLPLTAAFFGGVMNLASRNVREVQPVFACIFNDVVALVFATVSGGAFSNAAEFFPESADVNLGLLVMAGIIGWVGLLSNVKGMQSVSVPAVASIAAYISVALGYTFQIIFFGEPLDALSVVGAMLIVGTNIASILYKAFVEGKAPAPKDQEQQEKIDCDYKLLQAEAAEVDEKVAAA